MTVLQNLLTRNEFSRPGDALINVLGLAMHYTANSGASAQANHDFFENRKYGKDGYGSAHYIIGIQGEIIQCIPETEICYGVGSSQVDPVSGKIYTDLARETFGENYCLNTSNSTTPNQCTISIEMCNISDDGSFSQATINSAHLLAIDICKRHGFNPLTNIFRHYDIVGWKNCPLLWVKNPVLFDDFKNVVKEMV